MFHDSLIHINVTKSHHRSLTVKIIQMFPLIRIHEIIKAESLYLLKLVVRIFIIKMPFLKQNL